MTNVSSFRRLFRSGRKRKRPSFFQEFENEESNLDKILDDFEQEQLEESKYPKPKRAVKNPGSRPRQRRRIQEDDYEDDDDEVELETTRSGSKINPRSPFGSAAFARKVRSPRITTRL